MSGLSQVIGQVQQTSLAGQYTTNSGCVYGANPDCNDGDWHYQTLTNCGSGIHSNTVQYVCVPLNVATCPTLSGGRADAEWAPNSNNSGLVQCTYTAQQFNNIDDVNTWTETFQQGQGFAASTETLDQYFCSQ